jgi:transposase
MSKVVIGIDISKKTFDVSFKDKDGKWKHSNFENTSKGFVQFNEWISQHNIGDIHIVMEATGRYGEKLSYYCYNLGLSISVVNPARIKYYGQSKLSPTKTDKADARLIADFGMHNEVGLWVPKSPERVKLQELTRCMNNLKNDKTDLMNRIEGSSDKDVIKTYGSLISTIQKKIDNLEQKSLDIVKKDEGLNRDYNNLCSYPGIGQWTALAVLSEVPDIEMFEHVKQLTAYAGLNPSVRQSGTSVSGRGSISKMGSSQLRKSLYMPTLSARRHNLKLKAFGDKLKAKGKRPKEVIVACMRKMLETIFWILKKKEPYKA